MGAGYEAGVEEQLSALTDMLQPITRGLYILEEDDLPESLKELLHGRAFVIDNEEITETSSSSPKTYYIAADKAQGLIVPARTLFIKSDIYNMHYRWTDDGDKWTNWTTLYDGQGHTYLPQEKCRFAEVQVYSESPRGKVTLRATR